MKENSSRELRIAWEDDIKVGEYLVKNDFGYVEKFDQSKHKAPNAIALTSADAGDRIEVDMLKWGKL